MRPEKRIDWLLEAFADVSRTQPGLRLVLVGSGPETPRLLELRDRLGLREICHLEPTQPNAADWMRGIDIFVNASSIESFPNAVLEAMACGCCVIGSNVGGVPELLHMARTAWCSNPPAWPVLLPQFGWPPPSPNCASACVAKPSRPRTTGFR